MTGPVLDYYDWAEGITRYIKIRHCHKEFLDIDLSEADLEVLAGRYAELSDDAVLACDWVPGAKEFLVAYHRKLSFFVISGTPDETIKQVVDGRNMQHYFVSVHGAPRNKTEIGGSLLEKYTLKADRVLFIGDAIADHQAAVNLGTAFLGRIPPDRPNLFPEGTPLIPDLGALEAEIV